MIFLKKITSKENHYQEVLRICLPLVLGLSATTVMEFTDRVFLANYSIEAISASLPAGITAYLFLAFFGGVGSYAGVFIAQYTGKGDFKMIGSVLWQAIYFTLFAGIFMYLVATFATDAIFMLAGHEQEVQRLESIYFSILCKGGILHVAMATLSTFYTGRGYTRPVMIITFLGVFVNVPLDYALIFGAWGMPEMGIRGAAIATVIAWIVNVVLFIVLIFTKKNNATFQVLSHFQFNWVLLKRLLRFGIPAAFQFTMDILAFTLFVLLVGRIGTAELAATNIVLSINALTFMPSMGASQGISILVGQALGRKSPALASTYVRSGVTLLLIYTFLIDLVFIFAPDVVLGPFFPATDLNVADPIVLAYARDLLKIVAIYLFCDVLYMIYTGALRGAGDTRFMMIAATLAAPFCLVIPVYVGIEYYDFSVVTAWFWILFFIITLFVASCFRYHQGKWKTMLVIEDKS
ncbi:MAG: MATE family efflux transporter [Desulfotalea sp.]|nr:MAG: MATE family efflux transporter [Desulfotalea sp.]